MSRKSSLCVALALFAVGSLLVGSASAATINVPNASFEDPAIETDGGNSEGAPAGWTSLVGAWMGTYNPTTAAISSGVDGSNIYCIYGEDGAWGEIYSPSLGTLQAGTYTLTVAAGADAGYARQDALLCFGTVASPDLAVNTIAASSLALGSLSDITATWTVASSNTHLGEQLQIGLAGISHAAGAEVEFDNVRLTFTPAPEPSTLAILASGLIGLVCYAWRKRK